MDLAPKMALLRRLMGTRYRNKFIFKDVPLVRIFPRVSP